METTGIADALVTAGEAVLRQGLIEHARKRLADAEEQHEWLASKIKPKNRKLADGHRKALDTAQKVMALLNTDLSSDEFVDFHALLMDSMDRVAVAFGSVMGWQGGKTRTGKDAADGLHDQPGGSRDKHEAIKLEWASGKYKSRDKCAEKAGKTLGMPFSTARKALRNTPDPT